MNHVLVWDLETVPDLQGFAAANDLEGKSDDEIREAPADALRLGSILRKQFTMTAR